MTGPMSTSAPPSVGPTFILPAFRTSLSTSAIGDVARPATATLPAMQRSPAQPKAEACMRRDGLIQIGVGHDDQVILRAAGRLHAFAVLRAGFVDVLGDAGRADERDRAHQRMRAAAHRRIPCRRARC